MRKLFIALLLTLMLGSSLSFGQTFNASVYTNYNVGVDTLFSNGNVTKGESNFNVRDAYFGGSYIFDANWNGGVNLKYDGKTNTVGLYTADVSYYNNISKDVDLSVSMGRVESKWYTYTNTLWNNYFINDVISSEFKNRTLDGVSASLINKNVIGTIEVFNTNSSKNKQLTYNLFVIPTDNLTFGGFFTQVPSVDTTKYGFNGFYKLTLKKIGEFDLSAEYGTSYGTDSYKNEYLSFFSEFKFKDNSPFSLIARYDIVNKDMKTFSYSNLRYLTAGINYTPNQYLKLGLNWRNFNDLKIEKSHNEVFINAGFSF